MNDTQSADERLGELVHLNRLYETLSLINQAIVVATTREQLLQRSCQVLVDHCGFRMAWVGWLDKPGGRIQPLASFGDDTGYLKNIVVSADDRPEAGGPSGTTLRTGEPCISGDLLNDPAMQPWRAALLERGYRASAAFPLRLDGVVGGTLSVYSDEPGFFQKREVGLLVTVARDISFGLDNIARDEARRQAELTVRHERDFSEAILNSLPGVLYLYDEAGHFLRWNENFERVTGYSAAEIATMHPLDFFTAPEKDLLAASIERVFTHGEAGVEAGFLSRDGRVTPYQFTGVLTIFRGRKCLIGVGIDLSARIREEQARRASESALARAEAADQVKSAFLATMSHELRTPLNSIIGFTGIILQGLAGPLNAEQTTQLGMVRRSARHLLALINDVLDISKIEAGQLKVQAEAFDLPDVIGQIVESLRPQADARGLALSADISPQLGEVWLDRRRVEQILLNLLNNAIKFTERGSITLAAGVELLTPLSGGLPRPGVQLRVTDSGIGIKPGDLLTLFQPFRQIDSGLSRQHDGTGLGLAICQRLTQLMGGSIRAESEWGQGSTFTVTLPLRQTT